MGDPIETRAIGSVFRLHRSPDEPLYMWVRYILVVRQF